jgi:hypothetical protein
MQRLSPLLPRLKQRKSAPPSPQPSESRYDYETLFHDDYIRVCRLLPGDKNLPLQCELIELPVQGCPLTYECLSYAWGESTQAYTIICAGRRIPITKTLYAVLLILRDTEKPRDLWIDQICINQLDLPERGRQVQMMADIYRNADHVIIWLGEASKNSSLAFKYAEQLLHVAKITNHAGIDDDTMQRHNLPGPGSKAWLALGELLQRPWFARSWVVQEISVAKEATLC